MSIIGPNQGPPQVPLDRSTDSGSQGRRPGVVADSGTTRQSQLAAQQIGASGGRAVPAATTARSGPQPLNATGRGRLVNILV